MQAVPKAIKDEVVAARELTTAGILFRILRTFQPGGLAEKSRLLEDLTAVPTTKTAQESVAALRLWKRKASRAAELCAQLPDPLLMIRTLDGISKPVVDGSAQASFRIATFRMKHNLDVQPSLQNLWLFYDLLLAEAEVAVHSTTCTSATPEPRTPMKPAVKAMQTTPSSGGKSTPSSSASSWPCKFWMSEGGCRQGQRCRWPHPWESGVDKTGRCWNCSSTQHLQPECPYKTQVKPPVGGDGEGNDGGGNQKHEKGKGKNGKGKGKPKTEAQKAVNKENSQPDVKKDEGSNKGIATAEEEGKGKGDGSAAANGNGVGSGKKSETNGATMAMGSSELLSEATKLLKSLHLPSVKKITLQELGDPLMSPSNLMLLDSGATHSLRRARTWDEWNQAHQTVVALAQGSTTNLRLKHGTNTLLSTPEDDSFGNGILLMGALAKIGFEIAWSGGDCRVHGPAGEKINVQVVNGCPMIECQKGMRLMEQLENDSQLSAARAAIVRAIMQQPDLMKQLPELDAETLFTVMLKKEFPDLPDAICRRIVPKMAEIDSEKLPWNRRMRRKMMKTKRLVIHLFSGPDEKTWRALDDANTMVICVDKVLHPRSDVLNDHLMMFLLKLATTGSVQAVIGGPPCRTVSACRYADDEGPKPVRSEQEPYGLATLTQQQRDWVEDDIAMFFRMKLIYMVADHYRPPECERVIFALEQPQDPKKYRSQQDIDKHHYMSVWRTAAWQLFQAKYNLTLTSFEQGAFGHTKPKPTTFAHNLQGFEELEGAKAERQSQELCWRDRPLQERLQESATWACFDRSFEEAVTEKGCWALSHRGTGQCGGGNLGL